MSICTVCAGNSRVAFALWDVSQEEPLESYRIAGEDWPGAWPDPDGLEAVLYASVRPELDGALIETLEQWSGRPVRQVTSGPRLGSLDNLADPPGEVGVDRLLGCLAGWKRVAGPTLVVDFGTAATYNLVNGQGQFLGGVIAPGLGLGARALSEGTSQLPPVLPSSDASPFATATTEAIQGGVLWSAVGALERIASAAEERLGETVEVLATGGDAPLVAAVTDRIGAVLPHLVLEGLRQLHDEAS